MVNFNEMLLNSKLNKLRQEYYDCEDNIRIKFIKEMGLVFLNQQMANLADVRVEKTADDLTEVLWKIIIGDDSVSIGFQNEDVYFGEILDSSAHNWNKLRLQSGSSNSFDSNCFDSGAKDFDNWNDVFSFIIKKYFVH